MNPVRVLKHEADEEKAETARLSSFVGAMAIGDLVKSTLGPKGMDKILYGMGRNEGRVEVTNDGATILKAVGVDNPAAKVLVEMSKVQDDEVGDGTTSVVVFASELLREAEKLIEQRIHPQTIVAGWRKATKVARAALEAQAKDHGDDEEKFREDLLNIARTTLSSKILTAHKDFFSNMAVEAVLRLKKSGNLDAIQITKVKGGTLDESFLDEGFLLNKKPGVRQPKRIENAKILIGNTPMDTDKIKVFGSRVRVDGVAKVAELELAEKEKMKEKVEMICKHDINVFINRQLIYNYPEQLFADKGVMAIEHADFDGIERLALVTGGEIVSTFGNPELVKLGKCDVIEQVNIYPILSNFPSLKFFQFRLTLVKKLLSSSLVLLWEKHVLLSCVELLNRSWMKLKGLCTMLFVSLPQQSRKPRQFMVEVALKCSWLMQSWMLLLAHLAKRPSLWKLMPRLSVSCLPSLLRMEVMMLLNWSQN